MRDFLKRVAQWIRDRPITGSGHVSPDGYGFNEDDNEECRTMFAEVEQKSVSLKEEEEAVAAKTTELYNKIFEQKKGE